MLKFNNISMAKRKVLAAALAASLVVSAVMAGCTPGAKTTPSPATTTTQAATESTPATTTAAISTTAPPPSSTKPSIPPTFDPNSARVTALYVNILQASVSGIDALTLKPMAGGVVLPVSGPFDIKLYMTKNSGLPTETTEQVQEWDNVTVDPDNYDPDNGVTLTLLYPDGDQTYIDPGILEVTLKTSAQLTLTSQLKFQNWGAEF
jgi:hypothetical protein